MADTRLEGVSPVSSPVSSATPNDNMNATPEESVANVTSENVVNPTELSRDLVSASEGSMSASPIGGFEASFYRMLMNPLLDQVEEAVNKNNEILDDVAQKMKEEREQMRKRQLSAHIPLVLQGKGKDLVEIVQLLENFLEYENYDPEITDTSKLIKANLRQLDKAAEAALVSHSVASFMSTLDSPHLKHLATKIVTDVTLWIGKLFQFHDASVYFHEEEKEGLTKICQLAMHRKYPKYATDGYEVLYPRPPVIYISSAAKPNLGQYLCHQLGLPLSCLSTVPCDVTRMNLNALQKLIEDDMSSGKTPIIVIAQAGVSLTGQTDNLTRLHEICRMHDVWLHLEGCGLSMLAAPSIPPHLAPATLANSVTLNLGTWLALPSVPFVTVFHSPDIALSRVVGLSTFNVRYKLNCLSLWMCLLQLGHDNIVTRLMYYASLARIVHERITSMPTSNELVLLELESPVVIVRYQGKSDKLTQSTSSRVFDVDQTADHKNSYFDTLNIWLVEALKREVPEIHISAVEIPRLGLCIRYSPLDIVDMFEMSHHIINTFLDCFERHVHILDATVAVKADFASIVEVQDNLQLVHLPTWAGLGAVQYIPEGWRDKLDGLPDVGKSEINVLNQEMVSRLKSTDTAFSLGVTQTGLYCIRFGLVTADTDLEELIGMVVATGKEIEESSKYLESMAEVIKQGIERAAADLEKENQEKLIQAGVLRQVPLVGSLLNWWSPPPKDPIKGRCFNLASGKVSSTETTYKYHMQIQENVPEIVPKHRDAPLKTLLKPARGRSRDDSCSQQSDSDAKTGDQSQTELNDGPAAATATATDEDENNTSSQTPAPAAAVDGNAESVDLK